MLIVALVAMIVAPLPSFVLDILLALNLGLSALLVLVSVALPDRLGFTAMPVALLLAALYRLALTIAASRLILLHADAGRVIEAVGRSVMGGNYGVGAVVFILLTIIQYGVVVKGTERVAEVSARFSLDAMPGRQLAIDADLRAGALSTAAALKARAELKVESQFYGAMDGAMKFVKGDAIASLAVAAINLLAGAAIGMSAHGMGALESLRVFGLLAVGNALVMQMSSLLVSSAAGLVVTRVSSKPKGDSLGTELGAELFGSPRLIALGALMLAGIALLPGMPALPFSVAAAFASALAWHLSRSTDATPKRSFEAARRVYAMEPVTIELGTGLSVELRQKPDGSSALHKSIEQIRERVFRDLGVELPGVRVCKVPDASDRAYRLYVHEVSAGEGTVADRSPIDAPEMIARHLERLVRRSSDRFVSFQSVQNALDELSARQPALVHAVVPSPISLALLTEVLRRLVRENVSIRPLGEILEALSLLGTREADPDRLAESVRASLARYITRTYSRQGEIALHQLDPEIEDIMRDALHQNGKSSYLALAPDLARNIIEAISNAYAREEGDGPAPILTHSDLRPHLKRLIAVELSDIPVLSYADLTPDAALKPLPLIRIDTEKK